jgi:hypothetical protein
VQQKSIVEDTWCDACKEADLGMIHPVEFEENGEIIVEGICARCAGPIRTAIVVKERKEV